jgi:hypothetical protein
MKKLLWLLISTLILLIFTVHCYAVSIEIEPNNDGSTATHMLSGESIIGQLSSRDDQDWFSVCTSGSDVIQVTFTGKTSSSISSWTISIIDFSGNILSKKIHKAYFSSDEKTSQIFASSIDLGIYYVVIEFDDEIYYHPHPSDNYTLSLSLSNPGDCYGQTTHNGIEYGAEGIWQIEGQNNFISVNVNNSMMIGITYFPGAGEGFIVGTISENTGHITYASDVSQFDAIFTFTSNDTATLTVNNCIPFSGDRCMFPTGLTIRAKKIF